MLHCGGHHITQLRELEDVVSNGVVYVPVHLNHSVVSSVVDHQLSQVVIVVMLVLAREARVVRRVVSHVHEAKKFNAVVNPELISKS